MIFESKKDFVDFIAKRGSDFKLLGLDVGDKKVGIAVVHSLLQVAMPKSVFIRRNDERDYEDLCRIIKSEGVDGIVVGIPLLMNNEEGDQAKKVRKFVSQLDEVLDLPIVYQDERYSTAIADTLLNEVGLSRKARAAADDKVSAKIILDYFFQSHYE